MSSEKKLVYLFRKLRNTLIKKGRYKELSESVCSAIINSHIFNNNKTICVFKSDDTIDISSILLDNSHYLKNTFVFPSVVDGKLKLYHINSPQDLISDGLSVLGANPSCFSIDIRDIDVILVPGLAFDSRNNWLIEDRKLLYTKLLPKSSALKLGVCVEHQVYNKTLPDREHKVDGVLTEEGIYHYIDVEK